ncbi:MAG: DUF6711 family protein [Bacteroides sp.]
MDMAFAGWLVKAGGIEIPMKYIKYRTYIVAPNQRLDIAAERVATGVLERTVVDHAPSKIEFTTPNLSNHAIADLNAILRAAFTNTRERRLTLTYYAPDLDGYQTGEFYMPDTVYTIYSVNANTILYEPVRFAFIEY